MANGFGDRGKPLVSGLYPIVYELPPRLDLCIARPGRSVSKLLRTDTPAMAQWQRFSVCFLFFILKMTVLFAQNSQTVSLSTRIDVQSAQLSSSPVSANWLSYNGDYTGRRYSALREIKGQRLATPGPVGVSRCELEPSGSYAGRCGRDDVRDFRQRCVRDGCANRSNRVALLAPYHRRAY